MEETMRVVNVHDGLVHVFEEAGLGAAPFRALRVTTEGGNCQFCNTSIVYRFYLVGADEKEFFVGSDCVLKTGDKGLIAFVELELKRRMRDMKGSLEERKIAALEAGLLDSNIRAMLSSRPHPFAYLARNGKTFLDYIEYFIKNNNTGWARMKLVKLHTQLVNDGILSKLPRANARNKVE